MNIRPAIISVLGCLGISLSAMEDSTKEQLPQYIPSLRDKLLLPRVQKAAAKYFEDSKFAAHVADDSPVRTCPKECPLLCHWEGLRDLAQPAVQFLVQRNNNIKDAFFGALIHHNESMIELFMLPTLKDRFVNRFEKYFLLKLMYHPDDVRQPISPVECAKRIIDKEAQNLFDIKGYLGHLTHIFQPQPTYCQKELCIFSKARNKSYLAASTITQAALLYALCGKNPETTFFMATIATYLPISKLMREIFMPGDFRKIVIVNKMHQIIQNNMKQTQSVTRGFLKILEKLSSKDFLQTSLWLLSLAQDCPWISSHEMKKIHAQWVANESVHEATIDHFLEARNYLINAGHHAHWNKRFKGFFNSFHNLDDGKAILSWHMCLLPSAFLSKREKRYQENACSTLLYRNHPFIGTHTALFLVDFLSANDCIRILSKMGSAPKIQDIIIASMLRSPKSRIEDFAIALVKALGSADLNTEPLSNLQKLIPILANKVDTYFFKKSGTISNELGVIRLHPLATLKSLPIDQMVPRFLAECLRWYFSFPKSFLGGTPEQNSAANTYIQGLIEQLKKKTKTPEAQEAMCEAFLGRKYMAHLTPIAWDANHEALVTGLAAMHDWNSLELLLKPKGPLAKTPVLDKISLGALYFVKQSLRNITNYADTNRYPLNPKKDSICLVEKYIIEELELRPETRTPAAYRDLSFL
jgi:hypothetical protein